MSWGAVLERPRMMLATRRATLSSHGAGGVDGIGRGQSVAREDVELDGHEAAEAARVRATGYGPRTRATGYGLRATGYGPHAAGYEQPTSALIAEIDVS